MMARDPTDRYPTPLAVIAALNDFLEPPRRPRRRRRAAASRLHGGRSSADWHAGRRHRRPLAEPPAWQRARRVPGRVAQRGLARRLPRRAGSGTA